MNELQPIAHGELSDLRDLSNQCFLERANDGRVFAVSRFILVNGEEYRLHENGQVAHPSALVLTDKENIGPRTIIEEDAQIHQGVKIGRNVTVGQYAMLEMGSEVGDNTSVGSKTRIESHAIIKENCEIGKSAVVGIRSEIGQGVVIEDYAFVHEGLSVGARSLIMRMARLKTNVKAGTLVYDRGTFLRAKKGSKF